MMSPREALAIVHRVTVRNPPFPIRVEARVSERGGLEVNVITTVPCRDTGTPIRVRHTEHVCPFSEEQVLAFVTGFIRTVFDHEFKECLHVDGVRVRDPHANEAKR
jgi:hypothetical protein